MKRFMLVQVIERDMSYEFFDTLKEAQTEMRNQFYCSCYEPEEYIDDQMADIKEMSAWVTDGNNHDDYDWWIVDLQAQ